MFTLGYQMIHKWPGQHLYIWVELTLGIVSGRYFKHKRKQCTWMFTEDYRMDCILHLPSEPMCQSLCLFWTRLLMWPFDKHGHFPLLHLHSLLQMTCFSSFIIEQCRNHCHSNFSKHILAVTQGTERLWPDSHEQGFFWACSQSRKTSLFYLDNNTIIPSVSAN